MSDKGSEAEAQEEKVDPVAALDLGVEKGVLTRGGPWFKFGDLQLGRGREKSAAFLVTHPEIREKIGEAMGVEIMVEMPRPEPSDSQDGDIIYCCDRHPFLSVLIPAWRENRMNVEYVRFFGGKLNLSRMQVKEGLNEQQIHQAMKVLEKTPWAYYHKLEPGHVYRCGGCGAEFKNPRDLQEHQVWKHGELMCGARRAA